MTPRNVLRRLQRSLFLATMALAGCAGAPREGTTESTESNVTREEASRRLELKERIVEDEPAVAGSALGIVSWDLYALVNDDFRGTVALATGASGHVRYVVVADVANETFSISEWDEQGEVVRQPEIDDAVGRALGADLQRLEDEARGRDVTDQSDSEGGWDPLLCGLSLGVSIGVVATALLGGWTVGAAAVGGGSVAAALASVGESFALLNVGTGAAFWLTRALSGSSAALDRVLDLDYCR